jgi:hypothetical protein
LLCKNKNTVAKSKEANTGSYQAESSEDGYSSKRAGFPAIMIYIYIYIYTHTHTHTPCFVSSDENGTETAAGKQDRISSDKVNG